MFKKQLSLYFPSQYTPTTRQADTLNKIGNALQDHKFVICCAPTGSGKSMLAKTLAETTAEPTSEFKHLISSYKAYKQDFTGNFTHSDECLEQPPSGAFALTITKTLQDQYQSLFTDADILKGKANYICDVDENFMVDLAPCTFTSQLKDTCCKQNRCSYYNNRNTAVLSRFAALNYKMFLALPDHVKRKNIIICDEASELEEELIRQFSAEISYEKLQQNNITFTKLITDNRQRARVWIYKIIEQLTSNIETLSTVLSEQPQLASKADRIKYQYFKNLHKSLSSIDNMWDKCEFVIDHDASKVSFTPLKADVLTQHIFSHAEKVVLLSATIIDHKHFAKTLGIKDYKYIEVQSDFDPNNSPIYVSSKYKLNYKTLKTSLPGVCKQIQEIISHHSNQKGIIHTHTQDITNFIHDCLGDNERCLYRNSFSSNEDILKEHKESSDPTILVSPSLTFGVDLKDELARFQILVKLPFLPLSSKRIKKLFEQDSAWYENKMLNAVVQAAGRATRSKDDHSVTYILDATFVNVITRTKSKLPKYFLDRIQ